MLQYLKIIVPLFTIFSFTLSAKEIPPALGDAADCSVSIVNVDKTNRTKLKCDGLEFEKEQEFLDSKFLRWGSVKTKNDTYITIFLSKGVHGEQVHIFSKKKKSKITEIASSWPIEFEESKDQKKLHYKKDSDSKGEYPSFYFDFK